MKIMLQDVSASAIVQGYGRLGVDAECLRLVMYRTAFSFSTRPRSVMGTSLTCMLTATQAHLQFPWRCIEFYSNSPVPFMHAPGCFKCGPSLLKAAHSGFHSSQTLAKADCTACDGRAHAFPANAV